MNESLPQRKRIRLADYDYSQAGAYAITICTAGRASLFGAIENGKMILSLAGQIVEDEWLRTPQIRPGVGLDAYVIMPNHLHAIVVVDYPWLGSRRPKDAKQSLDKIIAGFKSACTRRINERRADAVGPYENRRQSLRVWQRSYFDQIIHNGEQLDNTRMYIANNPAQWEYDRENPDRTTSG